MNMRTTANAWRVAVTACFIATAIICVSPVTAGLVQTQPAGSHTNAKAQTNSSEVANQNLPRLQEGTASRATTASDNVDERAFTVHVRSAITASIVHALDTFWDRESALPKFEKLALAIALVVVLYFLFRRTFLIKFFRRPAKRAIRRFLSRQHHELTVVFIDTVRVSVLLSSWAFVLLTVHAAIDLTKVAN